jgi:hypothetical protein
VVAILSLQPYLRRPERMKQLLEKTKLNRSQEQQWHRAFMKWAVSTAKVRLRRNLNFIACWFT